MNMTINSLRQRYLNRELTPRDLLHELRIKAVKLAHYNIWIYLLTEEELNHYLRDLENKNISTHPLWGIPFAIKDNIDLKGISTTAACPELAYVPAQSAVVVQKIIAAGGIPLGKTNLDQLATGLNGTRSPYGICHNAYRFEYISGGSSSGSAVALAQQLVSFSLGTDTAGSGRVPAAFNRLVGLKPTRGLLSTEGLIPACRSLDCISIFTHTVDDANAVLEVVEGYDENDAYSRRNPFSNHSHYYGVADGQLSIGIVAERQLKFFGDYFYEDAYRKTIEQIRSNEIKLIEIDYQPFNEVARLLYDGPWVTERYIASAPLIEERPEALNPIVRKIITPGRYISATEVFKAQYHLQTLKKLCAKQLCNLDCFLLPTAGKLFTIEELGQEPILYNSHLGYYTNFVNLLDLSAVALPTLMTDNNLPFGVTLIGSAFQDRYLLSIARRLESLFSSPEPLDLPSIRGNNQLLQVAVCGAHLSDLPLNWQLTERQAKLLKKTYTAESYRMYLIEGSIRRPGLIYDVDKGCSIEIEVWEIPSENFGSFVDEVKKPLSIGKIKTIEGDWVNGFICENYAIEDSREITEFKSWRNFITT